jgi:hypothetical protein
MKSNMLQNRKENLKPNKTKNDASVKVSLLTAMPYVMRAISTYWQQCMSATYASKESQAEHVPTMNGSSEKQQQKKDHSHRSENVLSPSSES